MSGGEFSFNFDQERAYLKTHCLEHDVPDVFKVLCDCALERRTPEAIEVNCSDIIDC